MSSQSVTPLPGASPTVTSYDEIRTWMAQELAAIFRRQLVEGWIRSGGVHGTSGTLVSPAFATEGFTSYGNRVTADGAGGSVAIDYGDPNLGVNPSSDTAWVVISAADVDTLPSSNFERVGSSNYYVDAASSVQPPLPADSAWLMQVTLASNAIAAVQDLRRPYSWIASRVYDATDPLYGAVGRTGSQPVVAMTTQIQAWLNAIPTHAEGVLPYGIYDVGPLTATRAIRLRGEYGTTNAGGSILRALANQTHVLEFRGGTGDFDPATFLPGIGMNQVTLDGGGFTISRGLLSIFNAGGAMSELRQVGLINPVGPGMFLHDVQDMVIFGLFLNACGDNTAQKACILLDDASANNVNDVHFIGCRIENMRWSVFECMGRPNDEITFTDTKVECRDIVDGSTPLPNLDFKLFNVAGCTRFRILGMILTNAGFFTDATIALTDGIAPYLVGIQVQNNVAPPTAPVVHLAGTVSAYYVAPVTGFNPGILLNEADGGGLVPPYVLEAGSNARANFSVREYGVGLMQFPDHLQSNPQAGGVNFASGLAGSLTGRSLEENTSNNPVIGLSVMPGYMRPLEYAFRLQASGAGTPITVSYRDTSFASTALQNLTIGTGWQYVKGFLTAAQALVAMEIVVSRDSGSNTVFCDAAYVNPDPPEMPLATVTCTASATIVSPYCNAGVFMIRCVSLGGSALVTLDTDAADVTIVSQQGTTFTKAVPGPNQIRLQASSADGSGRRALIAQSNSGTQTLGLRMVTAN